MNSIIGKGNAKVKIVVFFVLYLLGATVSGATFKISTLYPDGTFAVVELKKAAKDIYEKTEGRVKFKIYPGGVMGSESAVQKKVRIGQLHGFLVNGGALANVYKDSQIYNKPLAFANFDDVDRVRAKMDNGVEAGFLTKGWKTFGIIEGGFAYVMSNKKIQSIAGLKSSKLWLPSNDAISEKIAKAYNVPAIYLNLGDVLAALQTGAVDTIIAPPVGALTLQWYSKVKYVTDLPFMYTYAVVAMSDKHYKRIKVADRAIVESAFRNASQQIDKQNRQDNINAFKALTDQGLEIVKLSPEESKRIYQMSEQATEILIKQGEFSREIHDTLVKELGAAAPTTQ